MTLEDKELKIICHYEVLPQLKYFQSEVFELNEAIIRYENTNFTSVADIHKEKYPILEEIADVQLMLNQFKEYYDFSEEEIRDIMNDKADRQLERIKNE